MKPSGPGDPPRAPRPLIHRHHREDLCARRGKDFAAAQTWDDIKEQARGEKSGGVFLLT